MTAQIEKKKVGARSVRKVSAESELLEASSAPVRSILRTPPAFSLNERGELRCQNPANVLESFATADIELAGALLEQVAIAHPMGRTDKKSELNGYNLASKIVHSLKAQDGFEALLCSQMAATHSFAMKLLEQALKGATEEELGRYVNHSTRLLTAFAKQAEVLRAHRAGGRQTMTVKHVHVHDGGQAFVGTVNQEGGGRGGE